MERLSPDLVGLKWRAFTHAIGRRDRVGGRRFGCVGRKRLGRVYALLAAILPGSFDAGTGLDRKRVW